MLDLINLVRSLIVAAAMAHGVNATAMVNVACKESTFNRYAQNGQYTGLYQLGYGMQQRFYQRGYNNLFDPAQQANFVAEVLAAGGSSNWPTYGQPCWNLA